MKNCTFEAKFRKVTKKNQEILNNVEIFDMASEGKSLTRVNNMVLFVKGAVPGDVVNVLVTRKKRNYMEGVVEELVTPGPDRITPFCEHFGTCGGCTWQQLAYSRQLYYKEKQVRDHFERIGRQRSFIVKPIIGADHDRFYRNKLEYTFSDKRWLDAREISSGLPVTDRPGLGFHIPGKFDKVLNIDACYLQPEPSNTIRLAAREIALQLEIPFNDPVHQVGDIRNLLIRNNEAGDFMIVVVFRQDDPVKREAFMARLTERFPQIISAFYIINPKMNDAWSDQEAILFNGEDHLVESLEHLTFRIGPKSFFQTNTLQALKLYQVARELAGLKGNEIVYDLYTGTGTIALFIAAEARKVIGIEYVPEAIDDAKQNAAINGISNASFFAGDIKEILTGDFIVQQGRPDVVIMDPPRAGVHKDVLSGIMEAAPARIVYVSCNPATQARDIEILSSHYELLEAQPVDMFPHTMHVENVALLKRLDR